MNIDMEESLCCFEITRDHICEQSQLDILKENSRQGKLFGPSEAKSAYPKPTRFKIYDDDGVLYYEGLFWGEADTEAGFEPLDWARWDAGAVRIDYEVSPGKWETL